MIIYKKTKKKFALGKQRVAVRLSKALESLSKTSPKIEEVEVIHKLYLASKEVKMQKEAIINAYLWNPIIVPPLYEDEINHRKESFHG